MSADQMEDVESATAGPHQKIARMAPAQSPRVGPLGAWDRLVGPGATPFENAGTLAGALIGGALGWRATSRRSRGRLGAALLCADLVGGAWTNNTSTTRAWYHRPGTSPLDRVGFTAVHVHPFVAVWLWDTPLPCAAVAYAYALVGSWVVGAVPPNRQRATAWALTALGASVGAIRTPTGHQPRWLLAAYYTKLIAGHSVGPSPDRQTRR